MAGYRSGYGQWWRRSVWRWPGTLAPDYVRCWESRPAVARCCDGFTSCPTPCQPRPGWSVSTNTPYAGVGTEYVWKGPRWLFLLVSEVIGYRPFEAECGASREENQTGLRVLKRWSWSATVREPVLLIAPDLTEP